MNIRKILKNILRLGSPNVKTRFIYDIKSDNFVDEKDWKVNEDTIFINALNKENAKIKLDKYNKNKK